jgi:chromosomal replication initiation ATPase DnaA
VESNKLILNVKNLFAKQVLSSDFIKPITKALSNQLNANIEVAFKIKEEVYTPNHVSVSFSHKIAKTTNINKNYNFDNFIVTDFNKSAYNAAQSIFKKIY